MPLLWLSVAFLLGIVVSNEGHALAWPAWTAIAAGFVLASAFERRAEAHFPFLNNFRKLSRLPAAAVAAAFCLGAARMAFVWPSVAQPEFTAQDLAFYNDRGPAAISARVIARPEFSDAGQTLRMEASQITFDADKIAHTVHGQVQAFIPSHDAYTLGDVLTLRGQPVTPPSQAGFSYRDYLARQDTFTFLPYASAYRTGNIPANFLLTGIYTLRENAYRTINALMPQPEAGLLAGILLGIDQDIPQDVYNAFRDTGTAHIIAISGFNIAIFVVVSSFLLKRLVPRLWLPVWVIAVVSFYAVLAGGSASVVRAALMGSIGVIGQTLGRRQSGANTLAFTAALMALQQPLVLWDVGFQLSFAATLGLILYAGGMQTAFESLLERWLNPALVRKVAGPIGEFLLMTLAAQITTLPIILYYFQRFSINAVLANPLALPPQPLVMIVGGLATVAGMIFMPLGKLISLAAWPLLAYTIRILEFLASWKGGAVSTGAIPIWMLIGYYVLLLWLTVRRPAPAASDSQSWWDALVHVLASPASLVITAALVVFVWRTALAAPFGRLGIYALDAQGKPALLIRPPGGSAVLVGNGGASQALTSAIARRLPPFQNHLDLLVVPGLPDSSPADLTGRFPPRLALWNDAGGDTKAARDMRSALADCGAGIESMAAGDELDLGDGIRLRVLQTAADGAAVRLDWKNFRLLVPGGISPGELEALPGHNLDGLSIVYLTDFDLEKTPAAEWQRIAANGVIYAGSRSAGLDWISLNLNGWAAVRTDGEQMWLERGGQ